MTNLFLSQLAEPFRIGLLIALFITMLRTEAATGRWIPLGVGALFVAVLLPATAAATLPVPLWQAVASGVLANLVILAVIVLAWTIFRRLQA